MNEILKLFILKINNLEHISRKSGYKMGLVLANTRIISILIFFFLENLLTSQINLKKLTKQGKECSFLGYKAMS